MGAGPTGLTTGLEFARQGIKADIVDAKSEPSLMSRAVGILPHSLDILNKTGVSDRILEEGVKFKHVHIERDGVPLIDLDVSKILKEKNFLIGLPQDRTEALMSEKLHEMGVFVQYGRKVTEIETTDDNASVTFADGTTATYDWIIGADGVLSTVRKKLDIPYDGYELSEDWSIADVELHSGYDPTTIRAWLLPNNRLERDALVMVPIAENRVRLVSSTPDSLAAIPIKLDVKDVRRSGMFKISVRQARQYVKDCVVLAGDAAHAHSPVGGRGMNLGIDDAEKVVDAILRNTLDTYERERKKKAQDVINATERARKILVSNNPFTYVLLRITTWCVQHVGFLQKKFARGVTRL